MRRFALFLTFLFVIVCPPAFAAESPTPTPIVYPLPYPGLMPGQVLYPFKEAKDAVVGFFISSPMLKLQFHLDQAEKYVQASVILFTEDKSRTDRVEKALTKTESSLHDAYLQSIEAKKQSQDPHMLTVKVLLLMSKYDEVLMSMYEEASVDDKAFFKEKRMRLHVLLDEVRRVE